MFLAGNRVKWAFNLFSSRKGSMSSSAISDNTKRGALIVVEGVDRSGKSTQCELLAAILSKEHNIKTAHMRFPDRSTEIGSMIDRYLKNSIALEDECIHLLYSANRWEKKPVIEELLASGTTVVTDRYAYSGVAFSVAKGMDIEWCKNSDKGLPRPDLLLFLDISPEDAEKRPGFGEERYEVSAFQLKVRKAYETLKKNDENSCDWTIIDASGTQEEVHERMKHVTLQKIQEVVDKPILPLWQKE